MNYDSLVFADRTLAAEISGKPSAFRASLLRRVAAARRLRRIRKPHIELGLGAGHVRRIEQMAEKVPVQSFGERDFQNRPLGGQSLFGNLHAALIADHRHKRRDESKNSSPNRGWRK